VLVDGDFVTVDRVNRGSRDSPASGSSALKPIDQAALQATVDMTARNSWFPAPSSSSARPRESSP
jgi:hypothetical protein